LKEHIEELLIQALLHLIRDGVLTADCDVAPQLERARSPEHGEFASNLAMILAKRSGMPPRELAQLIINKMPRSRQVERAEIAGPGFINFHVSSAAFHQEIASILDDGDNYGRQEAKENPRYLLEFVSANPTGPLHVGHGRHAAYGATLGNLIEAIGYPVDREYYLNDAGRQMDILGVSVWIRILEQSGERVPFPEAGYKGDYIGEIAASVDKSRLPEVSADELCSDLPPDAPDGDKEEFIGALIRKAGELLGEDQFRYVRREAHARISADIEDDLRGFGIEFDHWFSEQSLTDEGLISDALQVLRDRGMLYEKDGATWFRATDYGDEKDRVVVRESGKTTYFAADIAYHYGKRKRGYDNLIDVLGSDHHGYVARVRAGLEAMGFEGDSLEVPLIQFVTLYRAGEKLSMSTRSGDFVTLRELRDEVGNDAARFFYVMRSNDQHLDFDLELAKSHSNDNPVYYIQYAHARVASVFRQLEEKSLSWDRAGGLDNLTLLSEIHEKALMGTLSKYPEIVELAANNRAPQHLAHYLRDLANEFHTYYNAHHFIVDEEKLRNARLTLISATRQVIANGLGVLGVSAPDSM